jgi:DNA polymerase III delta subunit
VSAARSKPARRKKAPDPATVCRELCDLAAAGKLPRHVVLLSPTRGEDEVWFPEQILQTAREWAKSNPALDLMECDGGSPDFAADALEAFLSAPGLFGGDRVLIFSRATKALKKYSKLADAIANSQGMTLVLVEACGAKTGPATKALSKIDGARVERFRKLYSDPPPWRPHDLDASEAAQFLIVEGRRKELSFEAGAAGLLVQIAGGRPMELVQSLDHFYMLGLSHVTAEKVREIVAHSAEGSAFEFAESVIEGNGRKAFTCLQHLRSRGLRSWDGKRIASRDAFSMMLAVLSKQRTQTAAIYAQLSQGVDFAAACKQSGVPSAGPIGQRMQTRLQAVDQEHLDCILRAVVEAETNVKSSGWGDSVHALELLAFRCHRAGQRRYAGR